VAGHRGIALTAAPMSPVQRHRRRDALQRRSLDELEPEVVGHAVGDRVVRDEDLAGGGPIRNASGDVHRAPVVVTVPEDDRSGVDACMTGREPRRREQTISSSDPVPRRPRRGSGASLRRRGTSPRGLRLGCSTRTCLASAFSSRVLARTPQASSDSDVPKRLGSSPPSCRGASSALSWF
jgi:hypothetical protein